jgi:hypothetical protein
MSNGEDFHKKFMMRAIELSEQGGIVEKTGGLLMIGLWILKP